MPKPKKPTKKQAEHFSLLIRYLILLALMFSLPIIYKILTPLTVYSSGYILKLFYQVSIHKDIISIPPKSIQIIPACVAGSAYLLTLILNLSLPIKAKKRTLSILFAVTSLFLLNILRIVILSILFIENSQFFGFAHKLFWYALSTLFVVGIWFLTIKIFSIKQTPFYTDFRYLIKEIKKK